MQNEPPQAAKQSGSRLCADFDLSRTCVGAWVCARMHVCLSVRLSLRACVSCISLCVCYCYAYSLFHSIRLCFLVLCHITLCYTTFHYIAFCDILEYYIILHYIILHYIVALSMRLEYDIDYITLYSKCMRICIYIYVHT